MVVLVGGENSARYRSSCGFGSNFLISFPKLFIMDGFESPFETSDISDHEDMLNGNSDDGEEDGTPRRRRRLRRRVGSLPVPQLGQDVGAGPPSRDSSPVMQLQLADESEEEEPQAVQPNDDDEPDQSVEDGPRHRPYRRVGVSSVLGH